MLVHTYVSLLLTLYICMCVFVSSLTILLGTCTLVQPSLLFWEEMPLFDASVSPHHLTR